MPDGDHAAHPGPRVAVAACDSYDGDAVQAAVAKTMDALGGMGRFVSPGERILLKPNLLIPRRPEEAVTTHPEVLRAVIRLVKEAGAVPVVGDSPAGRSTERILRHLADRTGITDVCRVEGVEFVLFTEGREVPYPEGRVAKSFKLTTALDDVDGVISIAKLKTHSFTRYTGAVKNMFGLVHGLSKAEYHMRMKSAEAFSEMLVDLAECVRPRLTVMDAIVGMDGDGPSAGRPKSLGLVMASVDVHALDAFALGAVGENPGNVPTIRVALSRGLLPPGLAGTEIVSDVPEDHRTISGFRMPPKVRVFGPIPRVLGGFAAEGFTRKPVFLREPCTLCGSCIDICPAEALSSDDEIAIDRGACIRCYCCQEVCPQNAVVLKRMPLRSWARSLRSWFAKSLRKPRSPDQ